MGEELSSKRDCKANLGSEVGSFIHSSHKNDDEEKIKYADVLNSRMSTGGGYYKILTDSTECCFSSSSSY